MSYSYRLRYATLFILLLGLFLQERVGAQTLCPQEASFTFLGSGCTFQFIPDYTGPGTVSHAWVFMENPPTLTCSTDHPSPTHTFRGGTYTASIQHTVTIVLNGVTTTYSCTQTLPLNCPTECSENFRYAVQGCSLQIIGYGTVNFGDGTPSATGFNLSHTYAQSGVYTVSWSVPGGPTCSRQISVYCPPTCCEAGFTGSVTKDCSKLMLVVYPTCEPGTHEWVLESCAFTAAPLTAGVPVQLTNINTEVTPYIRVRHTIHCAGGGSATLAQNIPIQDKGIFVGLETSPTNLTQYECVLPGGGYSGTTAVYVSGIVSVDKTFSFSGTDIRMHPESGFDILAGQRLSLVQKTIAQAECSCMWRGIDVHGNLTVNDATLQDAVFAARPRVGSYLNAVKGRFLKNYIGVRSDHYFFLPAFQENLFDGAGPLKDICGLTNIIGDVRIPNEIGVLAPAGFQNERGLAGMRLNRHTFLGLPALPIAFQNIFQRSALGIDLYNCNATISQNSRFEDIQGGAYTSQGTALRLWDDATMGNNSLSFSGNDRAVPDFNRCVLGAAAYSNSGGTTVDIGLAQMLAMQNGAMLMSGSISTTGRFLGALHNNQIRVDAIYDPLLASFSGLNGLVFWDYSPAVSNLDIRDNDIEHNVANAGGGRMGAIHCFGGDDQPINQEEVRIFRNRAVVAQGNSSLSGILLESYTGARVWGNAPTVNQPNAGIFINNGGDMRGIWALNSGFNSITCNKVTSIAPTAILLQGWSATDCRYEGNVLDGVGTGTRFVSNCGANTRFYCNEMRNNTIGLLYTGAQTGPQGSMSEASGNKWFTNGTDAQFAGGLFGASLYYARPNNVAPNEYPISIVGPLTWFNTTTAPPNCIDCTAEAQASIALPISEADELVATDALHYVEYDVAMRWWNRWNLYAKLEQLGGGPSWAASISSFKTNMGTTSLGRLADVRSHIRQLGVLSPATQAFLDAEKTVADSLSAILLSLVIPTPSTDSATLVYYGQVSEALETRLASAEQALFVAWATKQQEAASLLQDLTAIPTSNTYETSEKTVLECYLRHIALGEPRTPAILAQLQTVGSACPLVNGPAVYMARSFYYFFTGIILPDVDCPAEAGDRSENKTDVVASVALYPNPANDRLQVNLQGIALDIPVELCLFDLLGHLVLRQEVSQARQSLDIHALPSGTYFVRVAQVGKTLASTALSIVR